MDFTTTDGVRLRVRSQGEGGKALLLIHGWMVSGSVWDDVLPHLHLRDTRALIPDMRGSGESDKPSSGYELATYVSDLVQLLDDQKIEQVTLVGHSMGGQIAQLFAATHPERVRGAMLVNPVPAAGLPLPDDARGLFASCAGSAEKQAMILGAACQTLPEQAQKALIATGVKTAEACIVQSLEAWMAGGFTNDLASIRCPVLCVATDDPFLPADFLSEAVVGPIPTARLAYVPGPGHYALNEAPKLLAAVLDAFLAGVGLWLRPAPPSGQPGG